MSGWSGCIGVGVEEYIHSRVTGASGAPATHGHKSTYLERKEKDFIIIKVTNTHE